MIKAKGDIEGAARDLWKARLITDNIASTILHVQACWDLSDAELVETLKVLNAWICAYHKEFGDTI